MVLSIWQIVFYFFGSMLTCVLRIHVKTLEYENLALNDIKYLMFRKLNTQFFKKYFYIYLLNMCHKGRAHVNIFLFFY
jgi:hypothetical protein